MLKKQLVILFSLALLMGMAACTYNQSPKTKIYKPEMTSDDILKFREKYPPDDGIGNTASIVSESINEDLFADCNMVHVDAVALVEVLEAEGIETQKMDVDADGLLSATVATYNYRVKITDLIALRRRENQYLEYTFGGVDYKVNRTRSKGFVELGEGDEGYIWVGSVDTVNLDAGNKLVVLIGFDESVREKNNLPLLGTGTNWSFYLTEDMHVISMTTEYKGSEQYTGKTYDEFRDIAIKYANDNNWEGEK